MDRLASWARLNSHEIIPLNQTFLLLRVDCKFWSGETSTVLNKLSACGEMSDALPLTRAIYVDAVVQGQVILTLCFTISKGHSCPFD